MHFHKKDTDSIFQLSLTEIAFILVFLILLLAGWKLSVMESQAESTRREKQSQLSAAEQCELDQRSSRAKIVDLESELTKLSELKAAVEQTGSVAAALNSSLDECKKDREMHDKQIAELEATLTKFSELKAAVESDGPIPSAETLKSALKLKQAIETKTARPVTPGQEDQLATELTANDMKQAGIKKENQDLKGQVTFLRNKLEARGGRDYPPCWADPNTGKPQYLLRVDIEPDGLVLQKAWPSEREQDAQALPNITAVLGAEPLTLPAFKARLRPIFNESVTKSCRHYVILANHVDRLQTFNTYRFGVEEFFYKLELRR